MSIFISYSRKDADFVRRVHERLVALGRETWVDWEGIPPSADWMRRIEGAIDAAEAVACVLTPDFVASPVCAREVAHAVAQHKRLIPIVPHDIVAATVPVDLARLNWVHFAPPVDFEAAVATLLAAIDTDLDWVDAHTRLLVRAVEWNAREREGSLALRGADLKAAEAWLALGPSKTPAPTALQTEYVLDSRRLATRRRSQLVGTATTALVVVAVVATLAFTQRREATRQEAMAVARRLASAAERQRDQPATAHATSGPVERSLQLAAEALLQLDATGQRSFEADLAMRRALALSPMHVTALDARIEPSYAFEALVFDGADHLAAAAKLLGTTARWDLRHPTEATGSEGASGKDVALSPDGRYVAIVAPDNAEGVIVVKRVDTGAPVARLGDLDVVGEVAIAPGGGLVAIRSNVWLRDTNSWGDAKTTIRGLPDGQILATLPSAVGLAFSPDGRVLAGVVEDRGRVWSVDRLRTGDATPLATLTPALGAMHSLAFSVDGSALAANHGASDGPMHLGVWRVADWSRTYDGVHDRLAAVGPRAALVAVRDPDAPSMIHVIDLGDGREVARLGVDNAEPAVAFHPGGGTLAIASGKRVALWRLDSPGGETARIAAPPDAMLPGFVEADVVAALVRPDEARWKSRRWRVGGGAAPAGADLDLGRVSGPVARSADGRWLAVADGAVARVVDASSGAVQATIAAKQAWTKLAISDDGRHIAGTTHDPKDSRGTAGAVELWQVAPSKATGTAPLDGTLRVLHVAVAADGARITVVTAAQATRIGSAQSIHVFDAPTMEDRATAAGRGKSGLAAVVCALSSDGRLAAIDLSGTSIALRETATGRIVGIVDGASGPQRCVFGADGQLFANGAGDAIRVWDVASQTEIVRLEHTGSVTSIAIGPAGRSIAALTSDGTLKVWPLLYADLLAEACTRMATNIDPDLWERTMGGRPYRAACPRLPIPER